MYILACLFLHTGYSDSQVYLPILPWQTRRFRGTLRSKGYAFVHFTTAEARLLATSHTNYLKHHKYI